MTAECRSLTPEVLALVGLQTARVRQGVVEAEGLRRFTQAIMDPDPRYWDAGFAAGTRYGGIVTPALYVTHFNLKTPAGTPDRFEAAFGRDADWDGSSVAAPSAQALPVLPTKLVRVLNGGNEIEMRRHPRLGEEVWSRQRYADIAGKVDKEGRDMLLVQVETVYTGNDEADVLCVVRQTILRR